MPEKPFEQQQDIPPEMAKSPAPKDTRNAKERLYDKIPISVKTLDKLIIVLLVLLVATVVAGILKSHGIDPF